MSLAVIVSSQCTLVFRFDLGSHSIAHMVVGVTNQYSTREMLAEVSLLNQAGHWGLL